MILTDINTTKRGRISIYVDEEFVFAVEKESFLLSGIKVGQEVTVEQLNLLLKKSNRKVAGNKAISLLSQRSYTSKQLSEKLLRHADKDSVEEVVERMGEIGLIDDTDYAYRYSRDLYNLKHYAPSRIKQELRAKGIDSDTISEVLEQFDEEENSTRAAEYLRRKYPSLEDEKIKKRAAAALQRLGYGYSELRSAMELYDEEFDDD